MKLRFCIIIAAVFLSIVGCSNSDSVSGWNSETDALYKLELDGFTLIQSKGKSVTLGTDNETASIKDRPTMEVSFDYDFWIETHEVTCGDMGLSCEDSLPATDVTFYDAVLYANRRSKAEGLDTVYTYSEIFFDEKGNCIGLKSFEPHWKRLGYRLPTEAEWVYVANRGWKPADSWHNENSGYALHPPCRSYISPDGVCDMAGNAMEWVGDLLVPFRGGKLMDFVGGGRDNGPDERVVKGGSFRNAVHAINSYSRGDIYLMTASTKTEYIGFRLAVGLIPSPKTIENSTRQSSSTVSVVAKRHSVFELAGSINMKLVFRDDASGNLVYINFEDNTVTELESKGPAYHPDVSPDGKWVAYCTGIEGVAGNSVLYVRRLDDPSRAPLKLNVESAAIPRWRILENGDTTIVYVNSAANNKLEESFNGTSTWLVPFANGEFGSPKKILDGAYHGGVSDDGLLAVTGARLLRANRGGNSEIWYDGEQVCNVSLSTGNTKKTLFLDFSGKTGNEFVHENYDVHQRIFFADSIGRLERSLKAPDGYTFDHTEWVNGSDSLVVATLVNVDGAHRKVVLINAYTEDILELVDGEELWHPAIWIDFGGEPSIDPYLDLDSAGVYFTDQMVAHALDFRVKMEWFWEKRDSVTAVVLGSSRVMFGVNSSFIHSERVLNMGYPACDIHGISYLARHYVLNHLPKLEFVVLELSLDFMWDSEESFWAPIYMNSPGVKYDESHDFWVDSIPKGFVSVVEKSYKPIETQSQPYNYEDFLMPALGWGMAEVVHDSMSLVYGTPEMENNMAMFESVIREARDRNLKVILLVPPQNPDYVKTGAFGIYSVRRSVAQRLFERIEKMDAVLFDENKMGYHDYTSSMAYNADHLAAKGAQQLSSRLDSLFKSLKNN